MMILFMLLFCFIPFYYCAPQEEIIKEEVAPNLGGWNKMPTDSIKVMSMVKLLQNSYNKKSDGWNWSKFTEVEEAFVQVTNAINYRLTVIIEPTGCPKEEAIETCKTPGSDDMKVEKCHYFLVERPPNFKLFVIGKTCEQM